MLFEVGETVVYPHHGAATIVEIKTRTIKGKEKLYLKLNVTQGDLVIEVPAENVDLVGVRDVIGKEGLDRVFDVLRAPFTEEPTDQDNFGEFASHAPSAERRAISQDALVRLHDRLKSQLTPRGYILFLRLFVEEGDVDVVARDLGIARDAVYAWKYRFAGALKGIAADLDPAILEGFP